MRPSTHLILSPHFDDAALGLGGLIFQLTQAGEAVTVYTLLAGPLPPHLVRNPFIDELIARWQLGPDPIPGRADEDECAMQVLGAARRLAAFTDAPFRTDDWGAALYPTVETLFGDIHPHDPLLNRFNEASRPLDGFAAIYIPLGVGQHVDHRIVREAAVAWWRQHPEVAVFFYEEYPYMLDHPAAVSIARDALAIPTAPVIRYLTNEAIDVKIRAITCYHSQLSSFWSGPAAMADSVRAYAQEVGEGRYAERLWQPLVDEGTSS